MRQGKRFTPAWIRRAIAEGRGLGTRSEYTPWHQIRRADPGSRGRSHLIKWRFGRHHHLLSDLEREVFAFATMMPGVFDLREQFPLARERATVELAAYSARYGQYVARGTTDIASMLGIRHPAVRLGTDRELWVMSTDLVMAIGSQPDELSFLPISVKQAGEIMRGRVRELLSLEREYWHCRDGAWILVTPEQYQRQVAAVVVAALPWALSGSLLTEPMICACRRIAEEIEGMTLASACRFIAAAFNVQDMTAQQIFWKAVWAGAVPLDLNRWSLNLDPIRLLSPSAFWDQNPVVSRRTSWIS